MNKIKALTLSDFKIHYIVIKHGKQYDFSLWDRQLNETSEGAEKEIHKYMDN